MGINEETNIPEIDDLQTTSDCTYYDNINPPEGVTYWFQTVFGLMSSEEKEKVKKTIDTYIKNELQSAIDYYVEYYSIGDGNIKLKNNFIKTTDKVLAVNSLLNYLKNSTYKIFWSKNEMPPSFVLYSNAWAFTSGNKIYVNLFNFWDGTQAGKKSVYDTFIHELGHVIHNFMLEDEDVFKKPFYTTNNSIEKQTNPNLAVELGDKEIHAYLQSFRNIFKIKPFDGATEIVNILNSKISEKKLTWKLGELKIIANKLCFFQKNSNNEYVNIDAQDANTFINILMYNLQIKTDDGTTDEHWADTTYLFSNFVKFGMTATLIPEQKLPDFKFAYVDLKSIGQINYDFAQNSTNNYLDDIT
jgi:hypothetical protein